MLSPYAKKEWGVILLVGLLLGVSLTLLGWWHVGLVIFIFAVVLTLFFRDPERNIPLQRGVIVSPADGHISSIHEVEHFEPFGEGALCIRVFLSVFDVHLNRSPCHGVVSSVKFQEGKRLSVLNPESAEVNAWNMVLLEHPVKGQPVAAVRQIAGQFARTIYCAAKPGDVLQRGQRLGIIKLGSTTEVYLPLSVSPTATVSQGQKVLAGETLVATVGAADASATPSPADADAGVGADAEGNVGPQVNDESSSDTDTTPNPEQTADRTTVVSDDRGSAVNRDPGA